MIQHAAVMADDLPDLPMMYRAGYAMAVADAVEEVRAEAAYVTTRRGGDGAPVGRGAALARLAETEDATPRPRRRVMSPPSRAAEDQGVEV